MNANVADDVLGDTAPPGPTVACIVDCVWPGICIRVMLVGFTGTETGWLGRGLSNG